METDHSHPHQVQVSINIQICYLEMNYARLFTHALEYNDFYVGRPIRVNAEITLKESSKSCQVRLDLCKDPLTAPDYLIEKNR